MNKLKVLDLFSGIGGFSLGLERTGGFETVAFCEIEKFPQKVLAKHWPNVPIYGDVRNVTAEQIRADGISVDVVTGGFPCQDISVAGNQKGIGEGTRSGLWSECARLLGEIRPDYAIFENVTALLSGDNGRWFQRVLFDISEVGYDAEWHCIPASELGAHHHRDRVWIIAYPRLPESQGRNAAQTDNDRRGEAGIQQRGKPASPCSDVPDPNGLKQSVSINGSLNKRSPKAAPEGAESPGGTDSLDRVSTNTSSKRGRGGNTNGEYAKNAGQSPICQRQHLRRMEIWNSEPDVGRVANGIPDRTHRLKGLGNAVVPQIPELIGRAILEAENEKARTIRRTITISL